MAIQDYKVSESYSGRDVSSLPNKPNQNGFSAEQLKARFDQLGKEVIPQYNDLIDFLNTNLFSGGSTEGHTHNIDNIEDGLNNKLFTSDDNDKLDGIATGAEVNQNAFSSVKVGSSTATSSEKTGTFEIVAGLNIIATLDTVNKKLTLSATGDISTLASQSVVIDVGDYYVGDNVEDILQEIAVFLNGKVDKVVGYGLSKNDYDDTEKATVASTKLLTDNIVSTTKEPTGFTNNDAIVVSYDSTTRKVTLTGTFEAYFKGVKITELVSGWVSDAHTDATGNYFLYYNGTSFVFSTTPWEYSDLHIAYIQYNSHKLAIKETHGFMPYTTHFELHNIIGTYLSAGGDLSSYVLNSTTATDRRPDIASPTLYDEDLKHVVNALTSKSYTQRYLTGSAVRSFTTDQTEIIANNGSLPYWNQNVAGTWQQTLFANNEYGAIFVVVLPATSDTGSQKYRFMFVQPQQVSSDLATIQALTPQNLTHGDSSSLVSEFCFIAKIIIKASSSNWVIYSVEKLTGSRVLSVSAPSGTYLTSVTHDTTLSGSGTASDPLGVVDHTFEFTATIPYTSWTGSSAPFTKAVTVSGILSTDTPIIDIVQTGTYATDQAMVTNWALIYRAVTSSNTITFYATAVPSADISIQVKVVR